MFLTSDPDFAPTALLHNLKHNKVLHEHNVILTIVNEDIPRVALKDRVQIEPISGKFMRLRSAFRLHGAAERAEGAWRSRASKAGNSTSCRRRSSCRAGR